MPREGYKAITIKQSVFDLAEKKASKDNRSIANYVTKLVLEDK